MPRTTVITLIGCLCIAFALFLAVASVTAASVFGAIVSLFLLFIGYRCLVSALELKSDAEKLQRGRVR